MGPRPWRPTRGGSFGVTRPALLFDLDGTLIDSDPLHARVFIEMFAARGIEIDEAFYAAEIHGKFNTEIFSAHIPDEDAYALHLAKEAAFRDLLPAQIDPTPGARQLIARAQANGWAIALVTNACRANADAMLAALGLTGSFEAIVVGDEDLPCKPSPAPYRHAMEVIGADPARSIAFEDSRSGLTAAVAAKVFTVGVQSTLGDGALRALGADLSIKDFNDPALRPALERLEGALS